MEGAAATAARDGSKLCSACLCPLLSTLPEGTGCLLGLARDEARFTEEIFWGLGFFPLIL